MSSDVLNINITLRCVKVFGLVSDIFYFILLAVWLGSAISTGSGGETWSYYATGCNVVTLVTLCVLFLLIIAEYTLLCGVRRNDEGIYVGTCAITFWISCQGLVILMEILRLVYVTLAVSAPGYSYRPSLLDNDNDRHEATNFITRYSGSLVTLIIGYPLFAIRCWLVMLICNFCCSVQTQTEQGVAVRLNHNYNLQQVVPQNYQGVVQQYPNVVYSAAPGAPAMNVV